MILVAFVLVLVAAAALIVGALLTEGQSSLYFVYASMAACGLTFLVLFLSFLQRRRAADDGAARPEPLGRGDATRSAPVSTGSAATAASTDVTQSRATEPEGVVIGTASGAATSVPAVEAPAADAPVAPAPRPVAPRRVVNRPTVAGTTDAGARDDQGTAGGGGGAASWPAGDGPAGAGEGDVATPVRTVRRRVVRRVPVGDGSTTPGRTTRKVVRRATSSSGAAAQEALGAVRGLGPDEQQALLQRFGSLEAIGAAPVADIAAVPGVGDDLAAELKRRLA